MSEVYGTLALIGGEVYVEKEMPINAVRYIGEIDNPSSPGYALHIFRSCRNGRLQAIPYDKAEKDYRPFVNDLPSKDTVHNGNS